MSKLVPIARRKPKRARVWLAGSISGPGGKQEARIRDISAAGALVECDRPPPIGSELTLVCGEAVFGARVAWTGNFCIGIEFKEPVDPETLGRQIGPQLRVSAPHGHRGASVPSDEE